MQFDMQSLMEQFKKVPEMLGQVQDKLKDVRVTGTAGAGMIDIEFNGKGEALKVNISQEAFDSGREFVEGLVAAAINDANVKREQAKKDVLKSIPGLEAFSAHM